jgi:hypothetical protein
MEQEPNWQKDEKWFSKHYNIKTKYQTTQTTRSLLQLEVELMCCERVGGYETIFNTILFLLVLRSIWKDM